SRAPGDAPLTGRAAFDAALALNIGRVIGYSIGGLLVGIFGTALVQGLDLPRLMLILRMAVGVVMVLIGLRLIGGRDRLGAVGRIGKAVWPALQKLGRGLLPADRTWKRLV